MPVAHPPCIVALSLILPALFHATTADAVLRRQDTTPAVAGCQGALPQFAGTLRARPLGLFNEGGSPAFVTCAVESEGKAVNGSRKTLYVKLQLAGNGTVSANVSCTLVYFSPTRVVQRFPKTGVVDRNFAGTITWGSYETEQETLLQPAVSCSLPPGTGIEFIMTDYSEAFG